MFSELLELLKTHQGEISQDEICAQMDISPGTLQNIIDILIRKGRIVVHENGLLACQTSDTCPSTGNTCPGPQDCTLILLKPSQFSFQITEK